MKTMHHPPIFQSVPADEFTDREEVSRRLSCRNTTTRWNLENSRDNRRVRGRRGTPCIPYSTFRDWRREMTKK